MTKSYAHFAFCILFVLLTTNSASGEESEGFYAPKPTFLSFSISGMFIDVNEAPFTTSDVKGEKVKYQETNAAFAYAHPCTAFSGLIFGAGYVGSELNWRENPAFDQKFFNYVNLSIGAFSRSFARWFWTTTVGVFIDTEKLDFKDYALYQGVIWGRYKWLECLKLHVGFLLEVGLEKEKIWPILGFEWFISQNARLNVIFPIDISLEYALFRFVKIGGAVRFLRNRHRVCDNEPLPKAIFEYETMGGEVDLIFTPWKQMAIKGFAGSTFGGDLHIGNRRNKNSTHYKFKGSFYGGANAVFSF